MGKAGTNGCGCIVGEGGYMNDCVCMGGERGYMNGCGCGWGRRVHEWL